MKVFFISRDISPRQTEGTDGMTALKIIAALLIIAGAVVNYAAKIIVRRFNITERVKVPDSYGLSGEELERYKQMKALSIVKMAGFFILVPGVFMVFLAFR
jgi:multisubunit Na+/H+ antiporter MnhG subunit